MSDDISNLEGYQPVLDKGYVLPIETWGSDERIIEAARMSTGKGFQGWEGSLVHAPTCQSLALGGDYCNCKPKARIGDKNLLAYLYRNKHFTPFEMCGMTIEVKAPIFIFREWHRHRTQSYNEMSARYIPLPDESYVPSFSLTMERINSLKFTSNKQAQGDGPLRPTESQVGQWMGKLAMAYGNAQAVYEEGIKIGMPKELARLIVPVGRYSRMRSSANLRNWLGFLRLRLEEHAQWEIRQYAQAVAVLVKENFPRTYELFDNESPEDTFGK